jgi:hypothetical protein
VGVLRGACPPLSRKSEIREAIAEVTAENAKITKRKEMACFFVFFELFAVIQEFCNRLPKPEIRNKSQYRKKGK